MKKWFIRIATTLFWVCIWQLVALVINKDIILPGPVDVIKAFVNTVPTASFARAAGYTFIKIITGFFAALISGTLLAFVSSVIPFLRVLLAPFMTAMKSVPVASFVILALIWLDSSSLSTFIAFVMVAPIIYINVLGGIQSVDGNIKIMADIFKISTIKRLVFVYLPQVFPFFRSGCSVALGLCWKAGIAAELIGVPDGSLGEKLYLSKVYFETADLFALTLVIIIISIAFEKLFLWLLDKAYALYERM